MTCTREQTYKGISEHWLQGYHPKGCEATAVRALSTSFRRWITKSQNAGKGTWASMCTTVPVRSLLLLLALISLLHFVLLTLFGSVSAPRTWLLFGVSLKPLGSILLAHVLDGNSLTKCKRMHAHTPSHSYIHQHKNPNNTHTSSSARDRIKAHEEAVRSQAAPQFRVQEPTLGVR